MFARFSLAMFLVLTGLLSPTTARADDGNRPKNLIVMLADGSGYNTLEATRFWTGKPLAVDNDAFHSIATATYPLRAGRRTQDIAGDDIDPLAQDERLIYDSAAAWNTTPVSGNSIANGRYTAGFVGYEWHRQTFPDSASTMSALMTGVRTYNGAINVDGAREPVRSIAEVAKAMGKRVGTVTSVPFCHATPASGGGAHNRSRSAYQEIALEMFSAGVLDVIGGCGNPEFDDNGLSADAPDYDKPGDPFYFIPTALWDDLKNGTNDSGANEANWMLLTEKVDIEAIADGSTTPPEKLAMIAQAFETLQAGRPYLSRQNKATCTPGETPLLANVPDLTTLTHAALRVLETDDDGFFLMIEGGAVDSAMHGNAIGRMIEEYQDFDAAVASVIAYLEDDSNDASFENTLLIVTADHDHMLFGPDSSTVPFQPLVDNGPGALPGFKWQFHSHSNQPVPLFARGVGAKGVIELADKVDEFTDAEGRTFGYGRYTTQADVGKYLIELISE